MTDFKAFGLVCIVLLLVYFGSMIAVLKKYTNLTWRELAKQIAWQRTGGYWLFYCTFIYFWIAMYSVFVNPITELGYIQLAWILISSLPLWVPPLAKFLNMRLLWK
jgi:hypothetical protein